VEQGGAVAAVRGVYVDPRFGVRGGGVGVGVGGGDGGGRVVALAVVEEVGGVEVVETQATREGANVGVELALDAVCCVFEERGQDVGGGGWGRVGCVEDVLANAGGVELFWVR